ncbi:MAG: trypsin-like peptidase domain-containing protein [Gemmataceae bacterium]|nr:trypsin-like peptidase domain-containing protein [Gemmataceae bacterium]
MLLNRVRLLLPGTIAFAIGLSASPVMAGGPDLVGPAPRTPAPTLPTAGNPRRSPVVEVVERVRGAVVNIHSERNAPPSADDVFHSGPQRVNGMGTGIVIDPRGYIVTNHHVVEDVHVLRVRLADGSSYPAKIFARDPETDLALLKIEPKTPLQTMPLGTASDLMIGEPVIAIGNAFGYEHTVTTGVISATKRDVTLNKDIAYKSLIQTDASINPGNSGGPLVNVHGELIGVNVAIRAGAQGIGFAITVDQMIRVCGDLVSGRKKHQALHGIALRDRVEPGSSPAVRSLIVEQADSVTQASATPVQLQKGDVIVKVGDQPVSNSLDFERALLGKRPGEKINIVVNREGQEKPAEYALRSPAHERTGMPTDLVWRRLGMKLAPTTPETVHRVNGQLQGGLQVVDLAVDGTAARSGIQRGDILIGLHQWETLTIDNVLYVLNHPELGNFSPLKFFVVRGGQVRRGTLQ